MFPFLQRAINNPLRIAGVLWPLALLAPFVPGLPRPTNGGMMWRQETVVGVLLCLTLGLLWRRTLRGVASRVASASKLEPFMAAALAAFVLWSAASVYWAKDSFAALHYALSWGAYLLFFLTIRQAAESARLLRASFRVLGAVMLVINLSCIIGHLSAPDSFLRQNGLGEPVAVGIPLFAALALGLRQRRTAILCGATAVTGWLSVLQISERAPFIGTCVGLSLLALSMFATTRFRPRNLKRAAVLCIVFVAVFALQTFVPSPFSYSIHENVLTRLTQTTTTELNTQARMLYWGAAIEMWRARPLTGVGANGYNAAFPEAREAFAAAYPQSPLVGINEKFLSTAAHNEYLQILSELGTVGLLLFIIFCVMLLCAAWHALRRARGPLVPGAVAGLAVFALSSGASSVSFRWMGSGLLFFFAAALVVRFASSKTEGAEESQARVVPVVHMSGLPARMATTAAGFAFALLITGAMCMQATNVLFLALAQGSADASQAERFYASALGWNPLDAATHYNYGISLYFQKREREAVPHLRFALARGFNTSTCYAYLAGAEANSGDLAASERTMAEAARVYPRSIFVRVRHSASLARIGRNDEAEMEMAAAVLLDSRAARGWRELIFNDIDAALETARHDAGVAKPGELYPDEGVLAVLEENEKRFPAAVGSGWRERMRRARLQ